MGERRGYALAFACAILVWLGGAQTASAASVDWHDCPAWDVQTSDDNASQALFSVFCLVNVQRLNNGLEPLRWNDDLATVAHRMATKMVAEHFVSHTTPEGKGLKARVRATGYLPTGDDWSIGENLAWGAGLLSTPAATVYGWMASPEHRVNILAPDYRDIGLSIVEGSPLTFRDDGWVIVSEFGHSNPEVRASRVITRTRHS